MPAYGKSTGFKLFMGASTASTLPVPGSDTFTEIGELANFTPPGSEQPIKPYYVLNDGNTRAIGGRVNDRVITGKIYIDWSLANHALLETDASTAGGVTRNWYVLYPDSSARRYDFHGICNKFQPGAADAAGSGEPHDADISVYVTGAVTITP